VVPLVTEGTGADSRLPVLLLLIVGTLRDLAALVPAGGAHVSATQAAAFASFRFSLLESARLVAGFAAARLSRRKIAFFGFCFRRAALCGYTASPTRPWQ